jgi:hypothetical protein
MTRITRIFFGLKASVIAAVVGLGLWDVAPAALGIRKRVDEWYQGKIGGL